MSTDWSPRPHHAHERFVKAFNGRQVPRVAELLAPDATAEVLGSPFPVEHGREVIARTSLPHVLAPEAGLVASLGVAKGTPWILLRTQDGAGPIDTAIRIDHEGTRVTRIEYVVAPHEPMALRAIGAQLGLPTVAPEP